MADRDDTTIGTFGGGPSCDGRGDGAFDGSTTLNIDGHDSDATNSVAASAMAALESGGTQGGLDDIVIISYIGIIRLGDCLDYFVFHLTFYCIVDDILFF